MTCPFGCYGTPGGICLTVDEKTVSSANKELVYLFKYESLTWDYGDGEFVGTTQDITNAQKYSAVVVHEDKMTLVGGNVLDKKGQWVLMSPNKDLQ
jgi:hypothetical protein